HQAVVEADQCAGPADDAVARRVVLAPCVRAVIAIGAAAVAAVSVRATVIGVGATAAVIGGGRAGCDSTGTHRGRTGRRSPRLPPGRARGRWIGRWVTHLCL